MNSVVFNHYKLRAKAHAEEAISGFQSGAGSKCPPVEANKLLDSVMPKMKTKKSAAKRFRVRPGGTIKRGQAFKRHILTKKTTKNKRHLRGPTAVHETNMRSVTRMMPSA